jgi:hypothetical protein
VDLQDDDKVGGWLGVAVAEAGLVFGALSAASVEDLLEAFQASPSKCVWALALKPRSVKNMAPVKARGTKILLHINRLLLGDRLFSFGEWLTLLHN